MSKDRINLTDVLVPFFQDINKQVQDSLISKELNASGSTFQALGQDPIVEFSVSGKNKYNVKLFMPDWYAYLDEGVKGVGGWKNSRIGGDGKNAGKTKQLRKNTGKFTFKDKTPPLLAMRKYMASQGIVAKNTKRGQRGLGSKKQNALGWAIARSIHQQGLEQTNFYSDVVNADKIAELEQILLDALGEDILIQIELGEQ